MVKRSALVAIACALASAAGAPQNAQSTLPPVEFNVRAFGAAGDGQTIDTAAINRAIDAARAAGGGTVVFPAGTYLSGSIHLQSHVALFVGHGATIEAGPIDRAPCDPPEPNPWDKYQDFGHSHWHNSLIWGENVEDVAILGTGTIRGTTLNRSANERSPAGTGNKAIALENARNVTIRDVTIAHGGHFAILATGVDNFTVDNVRISNMTVNSPFDDGICLKSSYGLGVARATENVTITNCQVSGYDEGTLLDGTYKRTVKYGRPNDRGPTGRIKFGTESSGGFKNITISNCVFDYSRGLAIESVDGGPIEDISISNLTMHHIVNAPIFIRRGNRARTPNSPPPGIIRHVSISNVVATGVNGAYAAIVSGIPGYPIEDLRLDNIRIDFNGGGTSADAGRVLPEREKDYPEPDMFGRTPAYGIFARHLSGFTVLDSAFSFQGSDARPAVILEDVAHGQFENVRVAKPAGGISFVLRKLTDFLLRNCPGLADLRRDRVEEARF